MLKRIDRFEIRGEIGKGGMGTVFKAKDPRMKREVAIKLLNEGLDEKVRGRFMQEAQAAGMLQHEHIVRVFDVGHYQDHPYIVMELLVGTPLDRLIRQRENMPLGSKLELMEGLCSGLAAAHIAGIIHRDIKPANLMVCADNVLKILDFGVAHVGESGLTMTGAIIGTANYMSPEQLLGATVDKRSDIFAVGAVFYELLTYQRAFPGGQFWEVFPKIQNPNPTPIDTLCPDLDPEIPEMISKALQKNPDDRHQNVTEMGREISRIRNRLERVRAHAEVDAARRLFDQGEAEEAISRLVRFTPSTELVDEALAELRRKAEQQAREKQRKAAIARELLAAREAFDRSDFDSAIRAADEVLRLESSHEAAYALREQARQEWQREEQRRRDADARRLAEIEQSVNLAEQALRAGQFLSALSHAKAALARQPDHAKASDLHRQAAAALELEHRAERAVAQAHADFTAGKHLAALQSLDAFTPSHPLVSRALDTLRHELQVVAFASAEAATAEDRIEDARAALLEAERSGTPSDRLDDLRTHIRETERELQRLAQLLDEGATALAQRDYTKASERVQAALRIRPNSAAAKELGVRLAAAVRQWRDAEATRTIELARRLFDAGRHDEALAQLRNAPAHPLTQSTLENLEAKYQDITRKRDAEANRVVEQARQLFDAGRHDEALAQLRNAPAHPLTQSTLENLEAKYDGIQHERERQARDAEAHRTVERTRRLFDAGRHEEALAQLRNAPAHPLTQSTFEELEAKYTEITRERDAEADRIVEQAWRLFDAGRHEEALERLRTAPAHALTQSAIEKLEAKYGDIQRERDRQARDAEAHRTDEQARELFDAGHHEEALARLRTAPAHPLTHSTIQTLATKYKDIRRDRDAEATRVVEQARWLFDAGRHEEALERLRTAPTHALTQNTLETLGAKHKDITHKRERQARDAEAKQIVEQARQLFDAGRHDEAFAQLRNAPAYTLTQTTLETLEAKYEDITRERERQAREANRIVEQARRLFDAGRHDEALAQLRKQLRNAPAHTLTQTTLETLEAKYEDVTREREQQAREAKQLVEQARQLFDAGRHEEALAQLTNAPVHPLTQSAFEELAAKDEDIQRERERQEREANRLVEQARRLFDAGRHDEALAQLRNAPAHPLTHRTFEDLAAKYQDITRERERQEREANRIAEQARRLFDAGRHEEALEQLRKTPAHPLTQRTFEDLAAKYQDITRERERQERRGRRQARRAAAVAALRRTLGDWRHLTGAMVVVLLLGLSAWQLWPTPTSPPPPPPPVVETRQDQSGTIGSAAPAPPPAPDSTPKENPGPPADAPSEPPKKEAGRDVSPNTPPKPSGGPKPSTVDRTPVVPGPAPGPEPTRPGPEPVPRDELPKPPPPSPAPNLDAERSAIAKLIDNYVAAYERMDDKRLNQIDPTFRGIQGRALLKGLDLAISDLTIKVAPNAQSAEVTFTQSINYEWSRSNLPQNVKGTVIWSLGNGGGGWTVVRASSELGGRAEIEAELNRNDIEDTLDRFREAFNRQDWSSINQLYPTATKEYLYGDCSKVDLTFKSKSRADLLGEARAQVDTRAVRTCTPPTKQKLPPRESTNTFRLEKQKGSWIIVDLQISVGGK